MTITALPAPAPPVTMTADPATGTARQRAALAQSLIDLAVFLVAHPDAPIVSFGAVRHDFTYWVRGNAAEKCAEVDRVAAIIGQPAEFSVGGETYTTERDFGLVSYRAVAVLREPTPWAAAA